MEKLTKEQVRQAVNRNATSCLKEFLMEQKPSLNLVKPTRDTELASLVVLYKKLMGREPTKEELEEARKMLGMNRLRN